MAMTVAHITLSMGTGGIERLILDLCKGAKEVSPLVVCLDSGGELLADLKERGVDFVVERRAPGLDYRLIFRLARLFKKRQVEVVHSHNQACAFYAGIAAFLGQVPVSVVTEHSRNYIDPKFLRRVEKKVLSVLVNRWVTVSRELADKSIEKEWINPSKVKVILNGVDCYGIVRPETAVTEEILRRHQLPTDSKNIVMVARLSPIKNHELMLDALPILLEDVPEARLILVGEGDQRLFLEKKVEEMKLVDRVAFLGLSRQIPEILAFADVFVLCSHSEGLPLSLLEASAAGVPVVITEHSNGAGFIRNGENGIVVHDDPLSLAGGIKACLFRSSKVMQMSARAQREVREKYSLESTVHQYESLYRSLMAQQRRMGA